MFKELVCPTCGKVFLRQVNSMYKLRVDGHTQNYCGYNCYRKVQMEQEKKKKRR